MRRTTFFNTSGGIACIALLLAAASSAHAADPFDSGSDGSDGVLAPTENITIDMADHPDGIYQYESVNIPAGVTVSFLPNADNTPLTWLVQGDVVIDGTVNLDGGNASAGPGGLPGPGGYRGGNARSLPFGDDGSQGEGPGGGAPFEHASHVTGARPYGNELLLPLIGGSGGGGTACCPGGGGGGAFLLAVTGTLTLNGAIVARGGDFCSTSYQAGSGGSIRLVTSELLGTGLVDATTGFCERGSRGRIRVEGHIAEFRGQFQAGTLSTSKVANILLLPANISPTVRITSLAGVPVPASPSGNSDTPDLDIPATTDNPVAVEVACTGAEPGSNVRLDLWNVGGSFTTYDAVNAGTLENSTATFSIDLPQGTGVLRAVVFAAIPAGKTALSKAASGLAPNGEAFVRVGAVAALGQPSSLVFETASGKQYTYSPS